MRYENKVIIVTGASSGIGRATAKLFAQEGGTVVAVARRGKRLEALRQEVEDAGFPGKICPIKADVRDEEQLNKVFDETLEQFGHLDVLVNNAGVLDGMLPIHETDDKVYDNIYQTNQRAVFCACRRAVKIFLKQGTPANIVNVASAASITGLKGGASYIMTKHAVLGLTRNISASYFERGIRCNCIEPSNILTEVNRAATKNGYGIKSWQQRAYAASPLHTITPPGSDRPILGTPEDCANAIAYLADDVAARYISGAEIKVDAGFLNM